MTTEGVAVFGGQWRNMDARIVEAPPRANAGPWKVAYDVQPKAGDASFDDSAWKAIEPKALGDRIGGGGAFMSWYRITLTMPERIGSFDPSRSVAVFHATVDDYAEVWVNGQLPRAVGRPSPNLVQGFNEPNRVIVSDNVKPGERIQIAVFAMNGPISVAPLNPVFFRDARLEFFTAPVAGTANTVVTRPSAGIPGVIAAGTTPEIVVRGLRSADDPLWLPDVGLVFTESAANRIVKLGSDNQVTTFVGNLHGPLGQTVTRDGKIISLQTQEGFRGPRIVWPAGTEKVVADGYQGTAFGRPNDIVSDSKGGVYFSDLGPRPAPAGGMDPAVYYVPPGGSPIRVASDVLRPNGVMLSRDEKTLYVNDTGGIHTYAYDVQADGTLTNRRTLVTWLGRDRSVPEPVANTDGIAVDAEGRLYALTEAGVEVATSTGEHLGVIPVWCITRRCQNLTFGGPDKRTLYVAGGGTLLRIPMLSQGFAGRVK
jgi:gluconolactonase